MPGRQTEVVKLKSLFKSLYEWIPQVYVYVYGCQESLNIFVLISDSHVLIFPSKAWMDGCRLVSSRNTAFNIVISILGILKYCCKC